MKTRHLLRMALLLPIIAFTAPILAEDQAQEEPIYVPPDIDGQPDRLVGGASRSDTLTPRLTVLSPPTLGLTSHTQPVLYWFLSQDIATPIRLVIVNVADRLDLDRQPPLLELQLERVRAGIHRLALAEHGIALQAGTRYDWSIEFAWPPPAGSEAQSDVQPVQVMSRSTLLYQPARTELAAQVSSAAADARPAIYARAGYWYDSLATLQDLIEQMPREPRYLNWRRSLFQQAALERFVSP
jgi:hypothetical protein